MPPGPLPSLLGFRIAVALGGMVPVSAGLAGVLLGPAMTGGLPGSADIDSHFRYLSGLLLGLGLGFWSTLPDPLRHGGRFRLLTTIVVLGGLGRLLGLALQGPPGAPMLAALGMELVVTPLLCLWQARLAAAAR
ncbi:MAG: DUF4345 domain-containing protein [Acetobacteraceae bacterium]|nr:MAG: DUF4345 domain-containing protein [Acetobacteraceae bacterium]